MKFTIDTYFYKQTSKPAVVIVDKNNIELNLSLREHFDSFFLEYKLINLDEIKDIVFKYFFF